MKTGYTNRQTWDLKGSVESRRFAWQIRVHHRKYQVFKRLGRTRAVMGQMWRSVRYAENETAHMELLREAVWKAGEQHYRAKQAYRAERELLAAVARMREE